MDKVIVIGAGGHARSCIDILLQNDEYELIGCVDKSYDKSEEQYLKIGQRQIPVIGTDDSLEDIYISGIKHVFVALGSNSLRKKLYERVISIGFMPINIISQQSVISPTASIGNGICVMAGAVINANTVVGDNCIVNTNCSLDHDCCVGANCHIAPGVAVSGLVNIGELVQLGTGTSVIDGVTIGEKSFIGAGSVVVKDIPSNVLAYGVPARVIRSL